MHILQAVPKSLAFLSIKKKNFLKLPCTASILMMKAHIMPSILLIAKYLLISYAELQQHGRNNFILYFNLQNNRFISR